MGGRFCRSLPTHRGEKEKTERPPGRAPAKGEEGEQGEEAEGHIRMRNQGGKGRSRAQWGRQASSLSGCL